MYLRSFPSCKIIRHPKHGNSNCSIGSTLPIMQRGLIKKKLEKRIFFKELRTPQVKSVVIILAFEAFEKFAINGNIMKIYLAIYSSQFSILIFCFDAKISAPALSKLPPMNAGPSKQSVGNF